MINELNITNNPKSLFDQANDDIAAQNRIMQRADAYCLNDTTCPFYSQGKGSVIKVCRIFLSKTTPQLTGFTQAFKELVAAVDPVTGFGIRDAMSSLLAGSPDFPYIFRAIHSALNGDFSLFSGPTQTSQEILEASVGQPLICSDNGKICRFNESITHSEIDCSRFPKDIRILQPLPRSGARKRHNRNRNDSYLANLSKFPAESLRFVF